MHSYILNYTKLAFNSLKMIQNDTVYQPIEQGTFNYNYTIYSRSTSHVILSQCFCIQKSVELWSKL